MDGAIIERGRMAQMVLELPEYKTIMANVRDDLFRQFGRTAVANSVEREDIHKVFYALDLLEQRMNRYVSDGLFELNRNALSES